MSNLAQRKELVYGDRLKSEEVRELKRLAKMIRRGITVSGSVNGRIGVNGITLSL